MSNPFSLPTGRDRRAPHTRVRGVQRRCVTVNVTIVNGRPTGSVNMTTEGGNGNAPTRAKDATERR
jgi:hypothetical protein